MNLLKVNTAMITSEAVPNVFTTTGNTFSNRYNVMKGNFSQYSIKFVNELNKTRVKKIVIFINLLGYHLTKWPVSTETKVTNKYMKSMKDKHCK